MSATATVARLEALVELAGMLEGELVLRAGEGGGTLAMLVPPSGRAYSTRAATLDEALLGLHDELERAARVARRTAARGAA